MKLFGIVVELGDGLIKMDEIWATDEQDAYDKASQKYDSCLVRVIEPVIVE